MRHNIVALHLQSCIREHSTYNYVGTITNVSITEYVLYSCAFLNFIIQTIAPRQTARPANQQMNFFMHSCRIVSPLLHLYCTSGQKENSTTTYFLTSSGRGLV